MPVAEGSTRVRSLLLRERPECSLCLRCHERRLEVLEAGLLLLRPLLRLLRMPAVELAPHFHHRPRPHSR